MMETFWGIAISGIATFLATYLSNKKIGIITDGTKCCIAKIILLISYISIVVFALCSIVLILSGLMGLGGICRWAFQLYDDKGEIIFESGLRFADKLEPIWFVIRGMICLGACILLKNVAIPRIKKMIV